MLRKSYSNIYCSKEVYFNYINTYNMSTNAFSKLCNSVKKYDEHLYLIDSTHVPQIKEMDEEEEES